MDELTLLANALMALDDKLAACMKCGMCQSVCPVFGETMMEADVTRGKLTLLEKLAHRLIEDPDAVNENSIVASCAAPVRRTVLPAFPFWKSSWRPAPLLWPIKAFRPQEGHLPHPVAESETVRLPAEDRRSVPRAGHARRQQRAGHRHVFPAAAPVLGERHMQPLAKQTSAKIGAVNPRREKPLQGGLLPRLHGRQDLHQRFRSLPQSVRLPRSRRLSAYQLFLLRHSRPLVRRP